MNQLFALAGANLDYPLPTIVVNILLAFLIGLVMATVYKNTHRGLSYSASFTFTLALLTASGSILMMIVGNSLARAFSLFGAFSIIRFRTAVKEPKDIAFVFISLILGMAVGTNNYTIALVSTVLIIGAIYFMTKKRFGMIDRTDNLLTLEWPSHLATDKLMIIFKANLAWQQLVSLVTYEADNKVEMAYNIKLKPQVKSLELLKKLKQLKGVDKLRLVSLKDQAIS